ncbi:hypothetical protein [Nitrosophilus kaiyonis]|uniref:hypothetical protein n=1 Tax=Nitrosophilus kaiyonis TaxID=2930200 RepID=UPI002491A56C|nr:hypothetical protein [Nitrosophilus kaiyonis]
MTLKDIRKQTEQNINKSNEQKISIQDYEADIATVRKVASQLWYVIQSLDDDMLIDALSLMQADLWMSAERIEELYNKLKKIESKNEPKRY